MVAKLCFLDPLKVNLQLVEISLALKEGVLDKELPGVPGLAIKEGVLDKEHSKSTQRGSVR